MFSQKDKIYIAGKIEELLLSLNHPEMPTSKPRFKIRIEGAEDWSWAEILPNWVFKDRIAGVNPWNERTTKSES